ncbi:MAG: GNAT family N-acetyltransferase [Proteobacteria bacterium]|nr:GNAT family N-acetyltransferase [Pseudomonadota bacterium]
MIEKLEEIKKRYPEKFVPEDSVFSHIHPGDRIFIGTACGEPQYLVRALIDYVNANPKAFFDAEVMHVWTLGLAPYADEKFKRNFRHNSFFITDNTREAVNTGLADYSSIFFSQIPSLFYRGMVKVDVALIQTSLPDEHGYVSLGISVDIVKAAVENAKLVIVQVNAHMPRIHGDTFIHVKDIDFIISFDEPLLEFQTHVPDDIADKIGNYIARIVLDGDTIQVGYGSIPNAILTHLHTKKHLGVHSELLTPGVHDNPSVDFRTIDYTNNPLIIASHKNMTAINAALQIDLTGQATAESIGKRFYSGVGGQADFMRGTVLAPGGKTILAIRSTSNDGQYSRIVPCLDEGAGVTLVRGDIHYVVTEYGIVYLHGKNVRERAMDLISIAHPKFQTWLIEEAKKLGYIYRDQAFIPGKKGEYPENLETRRITKTGLEILLRPVKISDEPLLKDFFYSLSDQTTYRRFISVRRDMPHERLQEFVIIDYTKETVILAVTQREEQEEIIGVVQCGIDKVTHTAEVGVVVRDAYQGRGVGTELLSYLTYIAKRQGLLGFTADVLVENRPMMNLFEKMGFDLEKRRSEQVYELKMTFR